MDKAKFAEAIRAYANREMVTQESLYRAFLKFDNCQNHTAAECAALNTLFNIALLIERGQSEDDAFNEIHG